MLSNAKFIWLDSKIYPDLQQSSVSIFSRDRDNYKFGVAGFMKDYSFEKKIKTAKITAFGDTRFFLNVNSKFVGIGPIPSGGDVVMPEHYACKFNIDVDDNIFNIYARVQLTTVTQIDNSMGRGCFVYAPN